MKNKILKILGVLSLGFMFFLNSVVPVNAYSNVPLSYGGTFKEGSLKYWVAYSFGISDVAIGSSYVREPVYYYTILMSDAPIVNSVGKFISPNGTKYAVTHDYYRLDKSAYYGQGSYSISTGSLNYDQYGIPPIPSSFNANHTIKKTDGSDFFTAPLLTVAQFSPIQEKTQEGMMATIGLIAFLVALGICLVFLATRFRRLAR